jgi:hypothetical protein
MLYTIIYVKKNPSKYKWVLLFWGKLLNPFDANLLFVVFDLLFNPSPHKPHQKSPSHPPSPCTSASACSFFLSNCYSLNDGPYQPIQESTITQHLVFLRIVAEKVIQQNGTHFGIPENRDAGTSCLTINFCRVPMWPKAVAFEIKQYLIINYFLDLLGPSRCNLDHKGLKAISAACIAMQR